MHGVRVEQLRMTRLRIMSDLHLEFGPIDLEPMNEDVLVLAGDIGVYTDGATWAADYAARTRTPVVMIPGNHEFYRNHRHPDHTVSSTIAAIRRIAAREPLLTFLNDDVATVSGVTFVGATLWTDFELDGDAVSAMLLARRLMNDYHVIHGDGGRLVPSRTMQDHEWSVGLLRERLPRRYREGPVVVVTHHLPSRRSIPARYREDLVNAAYASNLDDLVAASEAALWVHGHTHDSFDYRIEDTRVLCNPRGYHPRDLNPAFNPNLVVEV